MRLPWQKRVERVDPNRPHRFELVSDPPAVIGSDPTGSWGLPGIIMTRSNSVDRGCAVCRRPRDHSIHDPEE
jgi:hypothetical protein